MFGECGMHTFIRSNDKPVQKNGKSQGGRTPLRGLRGRAHVGDYGKIDKSFQFWKSLIMQLNPWFT